MTDSDWLLFLAQLPATPSSLRVNVWRRLREAGSTSLQNGVWVLPYNEENKLFMERLLGYVRQNEASGQVLLVQALSPGIQQDILKRFEADRNQEYAEFLEQGEELVAEIRKETTGGKFTFAELEENEQNLERLRVWLGKIHQRDFFKTGLAEGASSMLQECRQSLEDYTRQVYTREGIETSPEDDLPDGDSQAEADRK